MLARSPAPLSSVSRRDFIKVCGAAAAAVGLPASAAEKMADAVQARKPSVIWLQFQECTGCTESLLRTGHPDVAQVILDLISLDYTETLMAAAGHQAEAALESAILAAGGKFICVVEGAIPVKDGGNYCRIGPRTALQIVQEVAGRAAAVIAIGSCASWGGVPSADPNPTGASGVSDVLKDKPVVNIPGCPANPYNLLGTILQFATFGTLPALDDKGRPRFAYERFIHDDCPRRPHFDAGRFAQGYGDVGHRQGYCLYKIGCKGPKTRNNCSLVSYVDVVGAWPVGIGAQCFGCSEKGVGFNVPLFSTIEVHGPTPPSLFTPVDPVSGSFSPTAVGLAGLVGGGVVGAGVAFGVRLSGTGDGSGGDAPASGAPGHGTKAPEEEKP
jgi:hydrogenase small subunit